MAGVGVCPPHPFVLPRKYHRLSGVAGEIEPFQRPCSMVDSENLYLICKDSINDPVALNDNLSNLRLPQLRDHTAQMRKLPKAVGCLENTPGEQLGISRGVAGDKQADHLQIV